MIEHEIRAELVRVEQQRSVIIEDFERDREDWMESSSIYHLKTSKGDYLMVPLIQARANLLLALSNLGKK